VSKILELKVLRMRSFPSRVLIMGVRSSGPSFPSSDTTEFLATTRLFLLATSSLIQNSPPSFGDCLKLHFDPGSLASTPGTDATEPFPPFFFFGLKAFPSLRQSLLPPCPVPPHHLTADPLRQYLSAFPLACSWST